MRAKGPATIDAAKAHFDRWSEQYERDPVSRWLASMQLLALEGLDLQPDDAILDVGCGTGAAVRLAAPIVARAVGVDVSPGMVAQARLRSQGIANAEFLEAEAASLPFPDGSFTALLCTTSLHHYPAPAAAIGEFARVLGSGGRALIADASADRLVARIADRIIRRCERSHVGFLRSNEVAAHLFGAGFTGVERRTMLRRGYMLVRARKAA